MLATLEPPSWPPYYSTVTFRFSSPARAQRSISGVTENGMITPMRKVVPITFQYGYVFHRRLLLSSGFCFSQSTTSPLMNRTRPRFRFLWTGIPRLTQSPSVTNEIWRNFDISARVSNTSSEDVFTSCCSLIISTNSSRTVSLTICFNNSLLVTITVSTTPPYF